MKKSTAFLIPTIVLTVVFYLLAYFFLPPPPPSASMMVLFAGIAAVLVWLSQMGFRRARSRKGSGSVALLLISIALQLGLILCQHAQAATKSTLCKFEKGPKAGTMQEHASSALGSPCEDGAGSSGVIVSSYGTVTADPQRAWPDNPRYTSPVDAMPSPPPPPPTTAARPTDTMPRVTGTEPLLQKQKEESGYGLYSYALLTHAPEDSELSKYQAFFKALIELPAASDLAGYLPKTRINITYLLLNSLPSDWKTQSNSSRVDYVISHYDYARSAAMLASLPRHVGTGPVIASSLAPMSLDQHPHPVLVQDLSTAQPVLMADYVGKFVRQAAQDRFWQPNTLAAFTLSLRNLLETAATGLGMSQEAVKSWVNYFK